MKYYCALLFDYSPKRAIKLRYIVTLQPQEFIAKSCINLEVLNFQVLLVIDFYWSGRLY